MTILLLHVDVDDMPRYLHRLLLNIPHQLQQLQQRISPVVTQEARRPSLGRYTGDSSLSMRIFWHTSAFLTE